MDKPGLSEEAEVRGEVVRGEFPAGVALQAQDLRVLLRLHQGYQHSNRRDSLITYIPII